MGYETKIKIYQNAEKLSTNYKGYFQCIGINKKDPHKKRYLKIEKNMKLKYLKRWTY